MLFALAVVVVALEVEHVSLQLMLGVFNFLELLLISFIFRNFLELVALVVAASSRAVIFPSLKTNPAKLVPTASTGHVIAALVFFDRLLAIWASLCVCHNPLQIRTLCVVLFVPGHSHLAVRRFV